MNDSTLYKPYELQVQSIYKEASRNTIIKEIKSLIGRLKENG